MEKHKPDISIMIVERDDISLQFLGLIFSKAGYCGELIQFTSLTEAVTYLSTHKSPDLLITDFFMNKLEDFRFLLLLKQLNTSWQKPVRVIILGDFETDKNKIPGEIKADFVLKPLSIDIVKEWLE